MSTDQDDPFDGLSPEGAEPDESLPPSQDDAPEREAATYPLNDVGNGKRFALYYGDDVMHVPRVGWFSWDGRIWQPDPDALAVRRLAQKVSERIAREVMFVALDERRMSLLAEAADVEREVARIREKPDDERSEDDRAQLVLASTKLDEIAKAKKIIGGLRSEMRRHARSTGNKSRIDAILIESAVHLSQPVDALDADPFAMSCESGLLRFAVERDAESGMGSVARCWLEPHAREQRVTKMMPVTWDPDAEAPMWDAFLARVQPRPEMRAFLQRWVGLSMTAHTGEQKMAFHYGAGANGKSVFMNTVARLLGGYAATAQIKSLVGENRRGGGDATPDLVPLIGARMVRASEPDEGERLNEGRIKELTGGERILVRALHSDFVEVLPVFKLSISGNHKPEVRGTDDGIWRRLLLVPWDEQIPKDQRDPDLAEKLWAEAPGILAWAARGLIDYLEVGLQEPDHVIEATAAFREESDPIGTFLEAACVVTGQDADAILSRELVEAFNFWLYERGAGEWRPGTVARKLKEKARSWRSPSTGQSFVEAKSSVMTYRGIRFQDAFLRRFQSAPKDQKGRVIGPPADEGGLG